ncbi:uncharacterized protein JN550_013440 [Neoarthrinium moseri]|uniref:uncharacterized protein n=1 Tax=Neoarthrinium moseri TaxID=1658444 RepID=UPI001FDB1A56|nr:uncharacterized protein JN550_013440 [Neoarthrinium moseri]KAI1857044.1 hypothetical protein JN550_013440 [Neoarthrinium moseri]
MGSGEAAGRSAATHRPHSPADVPEKTVSAAEEDVIMFDDSSDSDVSMSPASDDDIEDTCQHRVPDDTTIDSMLDPQTTAKGRGAAGGDRSGKRKSPGADFVPEEPSEHVKKVKLDRNVPSRPQRIGSLGADRSLLPPEIWHHIFTFVPPITLGTLVRVSRLFNLYLDPSSSVPCRPPAYATRGPVAALQPDAIWQVSRRRHWSSKMPSPLMGKTELDMWRLVYATSCQYCGMLVNADALTTQAKLNPGPGSENVKTIWPFATTSCGPCLVSNTTKEIDLLLSSSVPSLLLPALPFVLITGDLQVYTPSTVENGQIPTSAPLTKLFFSEHVDELKAEFLTVKDLGSGAAEEWLKGLEDYGKQRRLDAARWEKWESAGGAVQACSARRHELKTSDQMHHVGSESPTGAPNSTLAVDRHETSSLPNAAPSAPSPSTGLQRIMPLVVDNDTPFSVPPTSVQPVQSHQSRVRTREEVLEMKAARQAEIERRAMLLEPPLLPNILAHMPAFQAALQIITPLDDHAWGLLKPRLLGQRADAEVRDEKERKQQTPSTLQVVQEPARAPGSESQSRESKELVDKDWDDAQAPLRAEISMYADEAIRDTWDDGNKVGRENSPKFAADVLLSVRRRFYSQITKAAAAARSEGRKPPRDPPQGPFTQKLTLENMKWLFDTKIKPHTESYRKELFICNGCEDNLKAYGFEGVVQHYAAKHTSSLSLGSVVVYWRSEWPEVPPFHPDPIARSAQHRQPAGLSSHPASGHAHQTGSSQTQHITFGSVPYTPLYPGPPYTANYPPPVHPVQQSAFGPPPGVYNQQQGPYDPPFPHSPAAFNASHSAPPSVLSAHQGMLPNHYYPPHFGPLITGPPGVQHGQNYNAFHANSQGVYPIPQHGPFPDKTLSLLQLDDLARNSRDVWMTIAGVKELTGDIRVSVVLWHLAKRYRSRFSESPPLVMFIDGLSNNKEMRPVRNVNRLICKACQLGLDNIVMREGERSTFSLPQLVTHFQQKHIEPLQAMGGAMPDWTIDMVYIPDLSCLSNLRAMVGMDNHKFALITEAFPQAALPMVPEPPPAVGHTGALLDGPASIGAGYNPPNNIPRHGLQINGIHIPYNPHHAASESGSQHAAATAASPAEGHINPAFAPYQAPRHNSQLSSHSNSGQTSPDARQNKHRGRQPAARDRKPAASSGGKTRKGNARNGVESPAATKMEDEEVDKEAEAEAQRQEEEIRAMWAAERKTAARIASTSVAPQVDSGDERESSARSPAQAPAQQAVSVSAASGKLLARHPSPESESDDDDDLFASLESHLNEEHTLHTYETQSSRKPDVEPRRVQPVYDQWATREQRWNDDGPLPSQLERPPMHEHNHSQPPTRARTRPTQAVPAQYYQETSPPTHPPEPAHTRALSHGGPPGLGFEGRSTRHFHESCAADQDHTYQADYYSSRPTQELRRPSPPSANHSGPRLGESRPLMPLSGGPYTEAYELVLVQDTRGEYYIKRPIFRDHEPIYTRYTDENPIYRESTARRAPVQDRYAPESPYGPGNPVHSLGSSHQRVFDSPRRSHDVMRQTYCENPSRTVAVPDEEYDPRFPAAPPGLDPSRYVRYE